ncbi:MAG TPA: hypothetical protein VFR27_02895 [Mycobacterium sp.]|nr:hypothetical protein [Mycobacterium sp.]
MASARTRRLVTRIRDWLLRRRRSADRARSGMPVAVVTASLGGHPLPRTNRHR